MDAESALQQLLEHPHPEVRELAVRVLDSIDAVHRQGLLRIVNLLDHHDLLRAAAADPVIAEVLDLYELLPQTDLERAEKALESVRGYIQSHGGQLEVLGVDGGTVRVRLAGSCTGCSGSAMTLKRGVETALREGFPGFVGMAVEEAPAVPARPTFVAIEQLKVIEAPVRPAFQDAAAVEDVTGMLAVEVNEVPVLLHNVAGDIFAFRRGGDRRESYPVAIEGGRVKVAVNVPAEAPLPR